MANSTISMNRVQHTHFSVSRDSAIIGVMAKVFNEFADQLEEQILRLEGYGLGLQTLSPEHIEELTLLCAATNKKVQFQILDLIWPTILAPEFGNNIDMNYLFRYVCRDDIPLIYKNGARVFIAYSNARSRMQDTREALKTILLDKFDIGARGYSPDTDGKSINRTVRIAGMQLSHAIYRRQVTPVEQRDDINIDIQAICRQYMNARMVECDSEGIITFFD